ncbi:hypothetical protein [Streptomyces sp. NPDC088348]|uniref:hypothetical protein n=1 Tax=Streptomyces sp. NPDC088348 TaxID=3365853 RepID=UPI0038037143
MSTTTAFAISYGLPAIGGLWLGALILWDRHLERQPPHPHSPAGRRAAAEAQELARQEVLLAAGFVVSAAHTLYAPLYDTPPSTHAHS